MNAEGCPLPDRRWEVHEMSGADDIRDAARTGSLSITARPDREDAE